MSVFYYEPYADFERLFTNTFQNHFGSRPSNQMSRPQTEGGDLLKAFRPRMDLHENADSNTATATFELPSVNKEDVHIETLPESSQLRISAESKISQEHKKDGYAIHKRRFGKFTRTLQLPWGMKDKEIKASMENSVLMLTFPKTMMEQSLKKIVIA